MFSLWNFRENSCTTHFYSGLDPLDFQNVFRLDDDNLPVRNAVTGFLKPSGRFPCANPTGRRRYRSVVLTRVEQKCRVLGAYVRRRYEDGRLPSC